MDKIRRVITGIDSTGKSIFVSDEEITAKVPALLGGNQILELFGEDDTPTVPNDGSVQGGLRFFPPQGKGYRFVIFTYPPESEATPPADLQAAIEECDVMIPGMTDAVTDASGMHYSATVDLEYVISGEFTLTLDSGQSRVLRAGDAIIHCGENHSWANKSDKPATMLLVFVGANLDESRFGEHASGH